MTIYEVRVGKRKPMIFDNLLEALNNAECHGAKTLVWRKTYYDGYLCGCRRVGVAKFLGLCAKLNRICKARGFKQLRVVSVRECYGNVQEDECVAPCSVPNEVDYVASVLAEYTPSSELTIDDSSYVVKFYDVFFYLKVEGRGTTRESWQEIYATPLAEPKPHVMDY